jgi:uncharacterized protein YggE
VARNTIEVHVHDPALTSKVIDLAAGLDVIVVRAVPSAAPDDPIARSEALKVATAQARVNAEAMAAALGLRVVRILSAETVAAPAPAPALANHEMARKRVSAALPTPVEAGTLEISARVVVTLEVAP